MIYLISVSPSTYCLIMCQIGICSPTDDTYSVYGRFIYKILIVAHKVASGFVDRYVICEYKRSEEHTSELQSRFDLVCRLLLEKKKHKHTDDIDIRETYTYL